MLKQRILFLATAATVLGVVLGLTIAEGFSESPPARAVSSLPATTSVPASPSPTATAVPATPSPTATSMPATPSPTATSMPATLSPTAIAAPATPSPEMEHIEYTVQPGDILFTIAQRFGVTTEEILAVNTIADPDSLTIGEVVRIPRPVR